MRFIGRVVFGCVTCTAIVAVALANSVTTFGAVAGPWCDSNAKVACSCLDIQGQNNFCMDINQPAVPTWCSANGNAPCVAARTIQCPGNPVYYAGSCATGGVQVAGTCPANIPVNSCN